MGCGAHHTNRKQLGKQQKTMAIASTLAALACELRAIGHPWKHASPLHQLHSAWNPEFARQTVTFSALLAQYGKNPHVGWWFCRRGYPFVHLFFPSSYGSPRAHSMHIHIVIILEPCFIFNMLKQSGWGRMRKLSKSQTWKQTWKEQWLWTPLSIPVIFLIIMIIWNCSGLAGAIKHFFLGPLGRR